MDLPVRSVKIFFLLILVGWSSGSGILFQHDQAVKSLNVSEKTILQGKLTLLFANVTTDNRDNEISLYINEENENTQIVIWTIKNDAITVEWRMKNYTKIFLDAEGSIWIADIDKNYEGRYTLHNSLRPSVELTISEKKKLRGMLTLLFANVTTDNPDKEISLYVNGARKNTQIVIWTIKNDAIKVEWRMKNYTKIFMDAEGSIWIADIDENYEGRYTLYNSLRPKVELIITDVISGNWTERIEELKTLLKGNWSERMEYLLNLLDGVISDLSSSGVARMPIILVPMACGIILLVVLVLFYAKRVIVLRKRKSGAVKAESSLQNKLPQEDEIELIEVQTP